ncbi:hypothetical protein GCM10023347_06470 [Streptomyces chumphonensis]|uniref:NUDIX hydrolase n=1 Tax=Streptomyces chumphonensis TaxID=1214925 RepID=A0A927IFR1_9ACTN|nr:NUDIX hydrolase [Streptomyces chumphonensis]MBD3934696.1 NUDIX hydrolase [Streptomyces chumphonensis]
MTQRNTEKRPGIAAAIVVHEGRVLLVRRRISEGQLSWQFPAGEVEPGEAREDAAVRETREETGLTVAMVKLLGERVHPKTGRVMSYAACEVLAGTAHVADTEELAELAWVAHDEIPQYVPYGLFESVQVYLDAALLGRVPVPGPTPPGKRLTAM